MKATKNKLILKKTDYDLLVKYVYSRMNPMSNENKNAEQLYEELRNAEIHDTDSDLPADVVRINSQVEVEEQTTGRRIKFRLVTPGDANFRKEKLSVFAPLGIALIGYRKGQKIAWEMPSGEKVFYIKEVVNDGQLV